MSSFIRCMFTSYSLLTPKHRRQYYRQNLVHHNERKAGPSHLMIMGGRPIQLNGLGGSEKQSSNGSAIVMRGPGGTAGLGSKNDIRRLKASTQAEDKSRY